MDLEDEVKMVKSGGFCGWKGWGKGEKLDPLETKHIHGSKPTKFQHTNKSQKKLGLFLWGIFELGTKSTKTRLETQRGGSEIVINVAHDTKMM